MKIPDDSSMFHALAAEGFAVGWPEVAVAWEGISGFGWLISYPELVAFAAQRFCVPQSTDPALRHLAVCDPGEGQLIEQLLETLAGGDNSRLEVTRHRWRVLLGKVLSSLSDGVVPALLEYTDFWASWDYPPDSPHIIQGRGNTISPEEYYQRSTLEAILQGHQDWIWREKPAILPL